MMLDNLRSDLGKASKIDISEISKLVMKVGFRCMRCGWCCCPDPDYETEIMGIHRPSNAISIRPEDIRTIQDATGYEWADIVEPDIYSCIELNRPWGLGWILKRRPDGICRFFQEGSNRCSIYQCRPLICRCFPFFLDGEGILEIRHCYGTHQKMEEREALEIAETLIRHLVHKLENYIAIAQGLEDSHENIRLLEVRPENGMVLNVFDGEGKYSVRYVAGTLEIAGYY